jgi:hypothetical protein
MNQALTRVVGSVEESLCWRFQVHGKTEATYQRADAELGPFDQDRRRRLKRGETFQRLGCSGAPRAYQGLVWRPKGSVP